MALGKKKAKQISFWVETIQLQAHMQHPFLSFIGYFEGIDSERGIAYARVGFAVLTGILGPEPGGADTGSFHAVEDAPVDEPGDTLMLAPGFSEPLDGRLISAYTNRF